MATLPPDSDAAKQINAALREWRQGDVALDQRWFIHAGDTSAPLSQVAAEAEGAAALQVLTSETVGLVVLTQTCDIVRKCTDRPYVEVAPLVQLGKDDLHDVLRGRRPALAAIPALADECLAADLDRVMTVEKSIVVSWTRTPGYTTDAEGRAFAQALARKRVRFAFPDDFCFLVKKLHGRLIDKHDKDSVEGRALRALREIRVNAAPSWDAEHVTLTFWFVQNGDEPDFEGKNWSMLLESWLKLVPGTGRFTRVLGQVAVLDEITAADFVHSDPLDLDYLSSREDE